MATRITAVNRIAEDKRNIKTYALPGGVPEATKTTDPPAEASRRRRCRISRASSSPRPTSSRRTPRRSSSSTSSSRRSPRAGSEDRHEVRGVEEPDAVRSPHHRLDDRGGGAGAEGAAARRGGHLQPAARRACRSGSTPRFATASNIPPTEADSPEPARHSDSPYNTRSAPGSFPTPIANPGLAAMQAAAHPAKVDYLYFVRKADCKSHFFTDEPERVQELPARRSELRLTIGKAPGSSVSSATRSTHSLSPRMQNAAFAARSLDWAYVRLAVDPGELEEAAAASTHSASRART